MGQTNHIQNMTVMKIIGISPGTRMLGYAGMSQRGLAVWGLKEFKREWSDKKLQKILSAINQLIVEYQPTSLALKMPHPARTSPALDALVREINKLAKKHGITVHSYTLEDLEKGCNNKRELIDSLAIKYPELKWKHEKIIKTIIKKQKSSFEKIFEAVAAIELTLVQ